MSPGEKSQVPADPHFLLEQATFLWGWICIKSRGADKTSVLIRAPSFYKEHRIHMSWYMSHSKCTYLDKL